MFSGEKERTEENTPIKTGANMTEIIGRLGLIHVTHSTSSFAPPAPHWEYTEFLWRSLK